MSICIFPGTFNPIHEGHIKMAEFALDKYKFDKIIFIPAYLPPHKDIEHNLAKHRFEMVKLAIKNNSRFEVSDIEYQSNSKSYSIITVEKIIEQYCINGRLNFIIGTDAFAKIDSWYKADKLKKIVHFIVFPRKGDSLNVISEDWDYELADMDFIDVSSTEIRKGLKSNTSIEGYIKENGLYKI